ncbi:N-acetyltransferase [Stutzerimonas nitrititolerans]|uniref:N-acetyltransferase n=1 Tax=Stutzerimonas nitrititolerans TaxID=2482751 RepID=UPI0035E429F8
MIRAFSDTDMDRVLDVWLASSIEAHGFVEPGFWAARLDDMRNIYIPASETYVYESNGQVTGFFSLHEDTLAAIFVAPDCQGEGIGRRMMEKAKTLRARLSLEVYKENRRSVAFYRSCGFDEVEEKEDPHTGHRALVMVFGAVHAVNCHPRNLSARWASSAPVPTPSQRILTPARRRSAPRAAPTTDWVRRSPGAPWRRRSRSW